MRRTIVLGVLLVVAIAAGYRYWARAGGPVEVEVAEVRRGTITGSFTADGFVKGKSVEIAPKISGRVKTILVLEGQRVEAGEVLVRLEDGELQAGLREAEAEVRAARALLTQAETALALVQQQVTAREAQASAQLAAAQAQLDRILAGPKPQEIAQAEQQVNSARASLLAAEQAARRARALYGQGAIPRSDLDEAEARYQMSLAHLNAMVEALDLLQAGARSEEIAAAQAQVDAARAALDAARSGRGEIRLRQADVESARARQAQAAAVVERARAVLASTAAVAPFTGVVSRLDVEIGQVVSPALPVLTLVDPRDLWISAEVADEDAAKARVGLEVTVTSSAYPGRRFGGRIVELAAQAEPKANVALRTRIVRAKIRLLEGVELFKPGLEVDVEGQATVVSSALMAPSDALMFHETGNGVFVVHQGVARLRDVRVGYSTYGITEILDGLKAGDLVVVTGKDALADGRRVRIVRTVGF